MQRTEPWFHRKADVLAVDPSQGFSRNSPSPNSGVALGNVPSVPKFPASSYIKFDDPTGPKKS